MRSPTALCSYKVSYRIRDNKGETVAASSTTISANSNRCSDLCTKALNNVAVKVVEAAAGVLRSSSAADASTDADVGDGGSVVEVVDSGTPPARVAKKAAGKAEPAKPPPPICSVGDGPRLSAEEAEKRAAQVEVLSNTYSSRGAQARPFATVRRGDDIFVVA